jgi:hypothetical protein
MDRKLKEKYAPKDYHDEQMGLTLHCLRYPAASSYPTIQYCEVLWRLIVYIRQDLRYRG